MSEIKIYSLITVYEEVIRAFGTKFNYTISINDFGVGYIRFQTAPNLSAPHKTALQSMIDAIGYGTITP